jgi:hypothetical protein
MIDFVNNLLLQEKDIFLVCEKAIFGASLPCLLYLVGAGIGFVSYCATIFSLCCTIPTCGLGLLCWIPSISPLCISVPLMWIGFCGMIIGGILGGIGVLDEFFESICGSLPS